MGLRLDCFDFRFIHRESLRWFLSIYTTDPRARPGVLVPVRLW